MVKRLGGMRHKTRYKLRKAAGTKGKVSLTAFLKEYKEGDTVALIAEPAVQKGMFHPRHHGKTGKVVGKQGTAYNVSISDGNKQKTLVVHPIHMKHV
jgi:large subunit ribosomal protein L21e